MPVVGSFHTHFWEVSSTVVNVAAPAGGYPTWQAAPLSFVVGSVFGGILPFWERLTTRVGWSLRMLRIVLRWPEPKRQALTRAIAVLDSPLYVHASRAVKMTAVLPGFNEPKAWQEVSHKLKASRGWAENTWRALEAQQAYDRMIRAEGSTATNSERVLMIEMAYQSFAQHAVGSTKA